MPSPTKGLYKKKRVLSVTNPFTAFIIRVIQPMKMCTSLAEKIRKKERKIYNPASSNHNPSLEGPPSSTAHQQEKSVGTLKSNSSGHRNSHHRHIASQVKVCLSSSARGEQVIAIVTPSLSPAGNHHHHNNHQDYI